MKLIYVAGKFRAINAWWCEQNIRIAETWMMKIWKLGAVGVCPHSMGRFTDKEIPDVVVLEGTLDLMLRCDAVFMVPENWKDSPGAINERQVALKNNIPVFYDLEEVKAYVAASRPAGS